MLLTNNENDISLLTQLLDFLISNNIYFEFRKFKEIYLSPENLTFEQKSIIYDFRGRLILIEIPINDHCGDPYRAQSAKIGFINENVVLVNDFHKKTHLITTNKSMDKFIADELISQSARIPLDTEFKKVIFANYLNLISVLNFMKCNNEFCFIDNTSDNVILSLFKSDDESTESIELVEDNEVIHGSSLIIEKYNINENITNKFTIGTVHSSKEIERHLKLLKLPQK